MGRLVAQKTILEKSTADNHISSHSQRVAETSAVIAKELGTPQDYGATSMQVDELLKLMVDKGASDLHLKVPSPPVLRIDGVLIPQEDLPPLTAKDTECAFEQVSTQEQRVTFIRERELDFACSVPGSA